MNLRSWTRLLARLVKEQSRERKQPKRRPRLEWLEERLAPATDVWIGGAAGGNNWSIGSNWNLGRAPQAGDDLFFGAQAALANRNTTNDIGGNVVYNSITVAATGYTLAGSAKGPDIGLSGTFTVNANVGTVNFSLGLEIAPPTSNLQQVSFVVNNTSTLDISGQLFDLGTQNGVDYGAETTFTKSGGGILQLDGANTSYTGAITIANSGGIISITNADALGLGVAISGAPSSGITTVNSNAQLQVKSIGATNPIPENLKVNGTGLINDGALLNAAGSNVWAGNIEMDLDTYFGASIATTLNITGKISDNGQGHNLTKVGDGTIIFSHVGGDTYRGQTTINNGILAIQDPNSLGNTTSHFSTTTVNYNSTTDVGGTLQLDNEIDGVAQGDSRHTNGQFAGFVVNNEALVLNGPGYGGAAKGIGAVDNLNGNNTWTNNVQLGTTQPAGFFVNMGAESNNGVASNLLFSGLIEDPTPLPGGGPSNLNKVGNGRIIFTGDVTTYSGSAMAAPNTFTGAVTVEAGYLNIEDSQALGLQTKVATITVDSGASLELELKLSDLANTSGVGMISAIGEQNRTDSIMGVDTRANVKVPGSSDQMTFSTGVPTGTPPTKPYDLQLYGLGVNNSGALHSISGVNLWKGDVDLGSNFTGIGVDADPNQYASNLYFAYDYSLTISGIVSDQRLEKVDAGQLIMTNNNTYGPLTGQENDVTTLIDDGWITIRQTTALGAFYPDVTQTLEPYTQVNAGGALDILPPNNNLLTVPNNFILSGTGFNHKFSLINQAGALEDLDGYVNVTGLIQLNSVAGIGVENVGLLATPTPQMTLQDNISNFGATNGGITKLGSQRLIIQAPGSYTGPDTVQTGVLLAQYNTALGAGVSGQTTTVASGASLELGSSTAVENGGVQAGLEVWGEQLTLNGTGDPAFDDSALTVLASNAGAVGMVPNSDPLVTTDNIWRGPLKINSPTTITVEENTSTSTSAPVAASGRLIIAGNISGPATADLHVTGGGELDLAGTNTYSGTTFIDQGVVTAENSQAFGGTPTAEVQTISLNGVSANRTYFTLSFTEGSTTDTTAPIEYTGIFTDAQSIANALDSLATIGGAADISGFVTVTQPNPGIPSFQVVFGGTLAGFKENVLVGNIVAGPGSVTINENTAGAGGVMVASGATLQLAGATSIAGKPLIVQGTGDSGLATTPVPLQWFPVGPAPTTPGQTAGSSNVTGRVTGIVTDPQDPKVIYIATAGGGAWKTIDGGQTWRPLFDAIPDVQAVIIKNLAFVSTFTLTYEDHTTASLPSNATALQVQQALDALPNIGAVGGYVSVTRANSTNGFSYTITFGGALAGNAVTQLSGNVIGAGTIQTLILQQGTSSEFALFAGAITMDPNNFNTLYLGTGENDNSGDSFYGTGIYETTNAGQTWSLLNGQETQTITVEGLIVAADGSTHAGTFTVGFNGFTTPPLSVPDNQAQAQATGTQLQADLNNLTSVFGLNSSVTVTESPLPEQQADRPLPHHRGRLLYIVIRGANHGADQVCRQRYQRRNQYSERARPSLKHWRCGRFSERVLQSSLEEPPRFCLPCHLPGRPGIRHAGRRPGERYSGNTRPRTQRQQQLRHH